jgi:hypothetical protein
MQFISYTTAAEEIDIFSMPPPWEEMFVEQFTQGTDLFIWVADYLLVSSFLSPSLLKTRGRIGVEVRRQRDLKWENN